MPVHVSVMQLVEARDSPMHASAVLPHKHHQQLREVVLSATVLLTAVCLLAGLRCRCIPSCLASEGPAAPLQVSLWDLQQTAKP